MRGHTQGGRWRLEVHRGERGRDRSPGCHGNGTDVVVVSLLRGGVVWGAGCVVWWAGGEGVSGVVHQRIFVGQSRGHLDWRVM